jgi:hypothetical protein
MIKEKERFEILLEEIRGDVKLVLEGHGDLNKKIDDTAQALKDEIDMVGKKLDAVHASLKNEVMVTATAVKDELDGRIRKLEAVSR